MASVVAPMTKESENPVASTDDLPWFRELYDIDGTAHSLVELLPVTAIVIGSWAPRV